MNDMTKKVVSLLLVGSLCVEMFQPEDPQPHVHEDMLVPAATSRLMPPPIAASGSFHYGGWGSCPAMDQTSM